MLGISTSCSQSGKESLTRFMNACSPRYESNAMTNCSPSTPYTHPRCNHCALPGTKIKVNGLTIKTEKFQISIDNLLAQVKRNPTHSMRSSISLSKARSAFRKTMRRLVKRLGSDRGRIQPLIKTDKYLQEANERTSRNGTSIDETRVSCQCPWLADLRSVLQSITRRHSDSSTTMTCFAGTFHSRHSHRFAVR